MSNVRRYMQRRAKFFALLAIAGMAAAAIAAFVSSSLAAFEPCRVFYRTHQPVQDSLACQVHSAIGACVVVFILVALVFAVLAGVRWLSHRQVEHHP